MGRVRPPPCADEHVPPLGASRPQCEFGREFAGAKFVRHRQCRFGLDVVERARVTRVVFSGADAARLDRHILEARQVGVEGVVVLATQKLPHLDDVAAQAALLIKKVGVGQIYGSGAWIRDCVIIESVPNGVARSICVTLFGIECQIRVLFLDVGLSAPNALGIAVECCCLVAVRCLARE